MANILDEARAQAAAMFVNFSTLLQKPVKDANGVLIGDVWDMSARLGEIYPKIDELVVAKGGLRRVYASVSWSAVRAIAESIVLDVPSADLRFASEPKGYEFLLRRDVLDQQVVDTFNHKVKRVNDIHLLKVDRELVIAHVDIGLRGLLRRLDFERIADFVISCIAPHARYLHRDDMVAWKYVQPVAINPASMTMKLSVSEKQIASIPAADLGDIIFDLTTTQRMALFRALDMRTKAKVFENLEVEEQKAILKELDKKEAALIVTNMSADEATDLLEHLPSATVRNILTLVESGRAKKLSTLLGYSSDSAGGLMTTEYVAMADTTTIDAAIEYIKTQTRELEGVPYIYIVDDKNHLKGITTIRRLLMEEPKESILKTAFPKTLYVYLNNSVKEVAYAMDRYKVSAVPVIDENKTLHGIISMDDILSQVISIAWRRRPRAVKGIGV